MGYRSEVAVVLYKEDYQKLMEDAQPLKEKDELCFLEQEPKYCEIDGKEYAFLYGDWIKWYDIFYEVELVMNFLKQVPHAFIRMGEDNDDVEIDYDYGEDDYNFNEIAYPVRMIGSIHIQNFKP